MTRVLIVEDDAWLGGIFSHTLSSESYEVRVAGHAIEAIRIIDTEMPDVLVVDVLLTATTVFTLLHELQSYTDTAALPVILCTSFAANFSLDDVWAYGVRRIVDKTTMTPGDLVAAVRSVV